VIDKISLAWKAWGWFSENYGVLIMNAEAILLGLMGIALLIPGAEPERTLQKAVDFLSKYSRKKPGAPSKEEPK
jgi:hypothetical protein